MSNGFMIVTEKDWERADRDQRGWMIFNTIQNMHNRLLKIEGRPIIDKLFAFAGGIIGGALAYIAIIST